MVDCPCGTNGTSGGGKLQATRYCGGDYTNGAVWDTPGVMKCNFSDLARTICRLRDVRHKNKKLIINFTNNIDLTINAKFYSFTIYSYQLEKGSESLRH